MIQSPDLALLYSPGARGDFLAAVLLNRLALRYQQPHIQLLSCYRKIHTVTSSKFESEYTIDPGQIHLWPISIRIKLATADDLLNVAYFWSSKGLRWQPSIDHMLDYLIYQELLFRQYDSEFDHVVEFEQLFDIHRLQALYYSVTGHVMSSEAVDHTCHNIALQTRVNLSNYTDYFPTLSQSHWTTAL